MEQIVIIKKNGNRVPLNRHAVSGIKSAKQTWKINADDTLSIGVQSVEPLTFDVGDRVNVFGRTYRLNRLPRMNKTGANTFDYTLDFEGVQYDLMAATYDVNIDTTNNQLQDVQGEALTGNLQRFMAVLIANANRVFGNGVWNIGNIAVTGDDVTLTFGENDNCLSVLQTLCQKFNCEYTIDEPTAGHFVINMVEHIGRTLPYTFKYGRGNGLYKLNRENVSSANIITRLKAYGSTENITTKYRADRLCLPNRTKSQSVIQKTDVVNKYGIYEAKKYFDVKPTFNGQVQQVVTGDVLSFIDASIDFDLNAKDKDGNTLYLVAGSAARVHFNSGNLSGYEFDIHSYDHATHKITLVRQKDERGMEFPSDTSAAFRFKAGDKYKILNIALPDSYVANAEHRLEEQAVQYYDENSQPRVKYGLTFEKLYLERTFGTACGTTNVFVPGDYVHIVDGDIGVDKNIRITAIDRDLLDEYNYTLTIADLVTTSITNRVISELSEIDKIVQTNKLTGIARARRNWMTSREVLDMVFDTDGNYYTEHIRPLSIDTSMLAVGAKSQQFTINCVFRPNYNSNAKSFAWDDGVLVHFAIGDEPRMWAFPAGQFDNLSNVPLYLYIRCNRADNAASVLLTADQIRVEDDATTYTFLAGILSSEMAGDITGTRKVRTLSLTYGSTTINGRTIQTGIIRSSGGGSCYFDLDNNEIGGVLKFVKQDGTTGNVADIDTNANAANDFINNTLPGMYDGLVNQIDGKIETWYTADDPSTAWTTETERRKHVGDMWYNTGTNESFRYDSNLSWSKITDAQAIAALAAAANAQDTADGKRRVFTETPKTPYDKGDLWVQGENGGIMYCKTSRQTGAYNAADWVVASNYTGDENLNAYIEHMAGVIDDIYSQLDGKIETWFYDYDPSPSNEPTATWFAEGKMDEHVGDLFYNTASGAAFRFIRRDLGGMRYVWEWQQVSDDAIARALEMAAQAQDTADNKRRVFVDTPYPPYDIGDLWANGTFLKRCVVARESGLYMPTDWGDATNYTGDENLNAFIDGAFKDAVDAFQHQLDGKIECWYQSDDPKDNWPSEDLERHLGDQWYNTSSHLLYRFTYGRPRPGAIMGYFWERITDQDAINAADAASRAQDTADGKRRVFTLVPYAPYDPGDLWVQGESGDIWVCTTAKVTPGTESPNDWVKASKYTDDSSLNNFIDNTYNPKVEEFTEQVDGKIETWFTTADPSSAWTSAYVRYQHNGDLWFNTGTKELKRYNAQRTRVIVQGRETWVYSIVKWDLIRDQKAIDAYDAASHAQDTADGKRQVFVNTPYPPYDIGDLWVDGENLRTCVTAKAAGESYNVNDWDIRVGYDNTQTTIDGGLVTSGTIQVAGDKTNILAGMTGNGTAATSVRFWGGASYENRATAPFRVLQDGTLVATKAQIEGKIIASEGEFRGKVYATDGEFNGSINIANGAIKLNKDGSGSLGNGGITWQSDYGAITIPWLNCGNLWGYNGLSQSVNYANPMWDNAAMGSNYIPDADTTLLPANPNTARPYTFINRMNYAKKISGNGRKIWWRGTQYDTLTLNRYEAITLMFDGQWVVISRCY